MPLYDNSVLDEAMNAIKEEVTKDLFDSVINETNQSDYCPEVYD